MLELSSINIWAAFNVTVKVNLESFLFQNGEAQYTLDLSLHRILVYLGHAVEPGDWELLPEAEISAPYGLWV